MKKSIKFVIGFLLGGLLFGSCTNTDSNEEIQLFQYNKIVADDTGGDDTPPPLPPDPFGN